MLDDLLGRIVETRDRVARNAGPTPVLLKIAPDLSLNDLDDIVGVARTRKIDGMIVGNTTIGRPPSLRDQATAKQAGGLSGKPLYPLATRMLAETYVRVEGAFPLVGVGGIDSGEAALAKIRAGADVLQLYSALVFQGLGLVADIKAALHRRARPRRSDKALRSGRHGRRRRDGGRLAGLIRSGTSRAAAPDIAALQQSAREQENQQRPPQPAVAERREQPTRPQNRSPAPRP